MRHVIWQHQPDYNHLFAQFDGAYIIISEAFGTWRWSINGGTYFKSGDPFIKFGGGESLEKAKEISIAELEKSRPGITDPYASIRLRMQDLAERHPYKQVGNADSYSPYNEGYTDAINDVCDLLR
jgi:hypothetical protein